MIAWTAIKMFFIVYAAWPSIIDLKYDMMGIFLVLFNRVVPDLLFPNPAGAGF